jgi:hypothetical protein
MRNLLIFDKFSDEKESSKIFETQHNDPKSGSFQEKLDTVAASTIRKSGKIIKDLFFNI